MAKSEWSIKREERNHGGPFELEVTTTWRVFHSSSAEPVHVFESTDEAEYDGVWKGTNRGPIADVTLEGEPLELCVRGTDGQVRRSALLRPDVMPDVAPREVRRFERLLCVLEDACSKHQYLEDHSADYPIPGSAVAEAAGFVRDAWRALVGWVDENGLAERSPASPPFGTSSKRLEDFFAGGHHQAAGPTAYWNWRRVSYFKEHGTGF